MDFSLSDHQLLIRDTVREFMNAEVRPHVKDWERTDHFPLDAIQKLGALGCCGMLMPEEWGGPGLDTISYVLMLEEVAKVHTAMSTALGVTNSAVQLPLLAHGTTQQKECYLKRLSSGEILGAFCLTEPAAGSDAAGIQSTAVACMAEKKKCVIPSNARDLRLPLATRHPPLATIFSMAPKPGSPTGPTLASTSSSPKPILPLLGRELLPSSSNPTLPA